MTPTTPKGGLNKRGSHTRRKRVLRKSHPEKRQIHARDVGPLTGMHDKGKGQCPSPSVH
jgi:hypothetical protein